MRAQEGVTEEYSPYDCIRDSEPGSIRVHSVRKPKQDADGQDGREWPHFLYQQLKSITAKDQLFSHSGKQESGQIEDK